MPTTNPEGRHFVRRPIMLGISFFGPSSDGRVVVQILRHEGKRTHTPAYEEYFLTPFGEPAISEIETAFFTILENLLAREYGITSTLPEMWDFSTGEQS